MVVSMNLLIVFLGMGNRLPHEMKAKFRRMLEASVAVPSLSHYAASVPRSLLPLSY